MMELKPLIMVVDDYSIDRTMISKFLINHGYRVVEAEDGVTALDLAASTPDLELILMDISMPGMSGFEACRKIKGNPDLANLPVIMVTGREDTETIAKSFKAGAEDYVIKPVNWDVLRRRLGVLVEKSRLAKSLAVYSKQLEQTVSDRTADLVVKMRQLEEALASQKEADIAREKARKAAEEASMMKSEFLANMSHELRSPLNSMQLLSKHLLVNGDDNLSIKQLDMVGTIYKSGKELLVIIDDLLDLSRVEAGMMDLDIGPVSLAAIGADVLHNFSQLAEDKGLGFDIQIDPDLPELILSDGQRLGQVVRNLMSNAFKFTDAGKVDLSFSKLENDHNLIDCQIKADWILAISVSDTGIGIEKEKLEVIFNAFTQADGSITRKFGGTGLGLSISKEFSGFLGGEIKVKSIEGQGSTFSVYLPLEIYDGAGKADIFAS